MQSRVGRSEVGWRYGGRVSECASIATDWPFPKGESGSALSRNAGASEPFFLASSPLRQLAGRSCDAVRGDQRPVGWRAAGRCRRNLARGRYLSWQWRRNPQRHRISIRRHRKALIVALARKLLTPSSASPATRRECHQIVVAIDGPSALNNEPQEYQQ
jgi:hypothetical protein